MVMTFQMQQTRGITPAKYPLHAFAVRMRQTAANSSPDDAPASNQVGEGERSGTEDALLDPCDVHNNLLSAGR